MSYNKYTKTKNKQLSLLATEPAFREAKSTELDVSWYNYAEEITAKKLDDLVLLQVTETLKHGVLNPAEAKINSMMVVMARDIARAREMEKTGQQGKSLPDESFIDTGQKLTQALVSEIQDALSEGKDMKDILEEKGLTEFDAFVAFSQEKIEKQKNIIEGEAQEHV